MELDLQSFLGSMSTAELFGWDPAIPPLPAHLGLYMRAPGGYKEMSSIFADQ